MKVKVHLKFFIKIEGQEIYNFEGSMTDMMMFQSFFHFKKIVHHNIQTINNELLIPTWMIKCIEVIK